MKKRVSTTPQLSAMERVFGIQRVEARNADVIHDKLNKLALNAPHVFVSARSIASLFLEVDTANIVRLAMVAANIQFPDSYSLENLTPLVKTFFGDQDFVSIETLMQTLRSVDYEAVTKERNKTRGYSDQTITTIAVRTRTVDLSSIAQALATMVLPVAQVHPPTIVTPVDKNDLLTHLPINEQTVSVNAICQHTLDVETTPSVRVHHLALQEFNSFMTQPLTVTGLVKAGLSLELSYPYTENGIYTIFGNPEKVGGHSFDAAIALEENLNRAIRDLLTVSYTFQKTTTLNHLGRNKEPQHSPKLILGCKQRVNITHFENRLEVTKLDRPVDLDFVIISAKQHTFAPNPLVNPNGTYTTEYLQYLFSQVYTGFAAAKAAGYKQIHTGWWGCGAFGNDPRLTTTIQLAVAQALGIELVFHPFKDQYSTTFQDILAEYNTQSFETLNNVFDYLSQTLPNSNLARLYPRQCPVAPLPPAPVETTSPPVAPPSSSASQNGCCSTM